ncbi:MAG: hypothetical protein EBZ50_12185, partial [Alphaproteobacteria bacterium]|nr:hypothetical protein [Alphaproteobacteria bacterium]
MTIADRIAFDPGIGWPAFAALAAIAALLLAIYIWRGGGAPLTRGLGVALILVGLAGPMIVRERREPMADIAAVIIDQS